MSQPAVRIKGDNEYSLHSSGPAIWRHLLNCVCVRNLNLELLNLQLKLLIYSDIKSVRRYIQFDNFKK